MPKMSTLQTAQTSDRTFFILNALVSLAAVSFLAWLLLVHRGSTITGWDVRFLPAVNAGLNGASAAMLVAGVWSIKQGKRDQHRFCMLSAFVLSALFLVCYLIYHGVHGDTKYVGEGFMRTVYFSVLISHVVLSIVVFPMILTAFYWAFRKRWTSHKKLVRFVGPLWLYVSVTGVVIYFMLRGAPTAS
jgi:putative membrane protein